MPALTHKLVEVAAHTTISSGKKLVAGLPKCHCQSCLVLPLELDVLPFPLPCIACPKSRT